MVTNCTFLLREYDSPSGYYANWFTTGRWEYISRPYTLAPDATPCDLFLRVTVQPGDYLFHRRLEPETAEIEHAYLIHIPSDAFVDFCDRVPRQEALTDDFEGNWLLESAFKKWVDGEDCPTTLEDALREIQKAVTS